MSGGGESEVVRNLGDVFFPLSGCFRMTLKGVKYW
jgi:hypothetical protein